MKAFLPLVFSAKFSLVNSTAPEAFAVEAAGLPEVAALITFPLMIALIWASLAINVKRWHDRDKSGLWILIGVIPILGPIWNFIETGCLRGTVGPNRFGNDPT